MTPECIRCVHFFTPYAVANSKKALQIITHLLRYAKNLIFYLNML